MFEAIDLTETKSLTSWRKYHWFCLLPRSSK